MCRLSALYDVKIYLEQNRLLVSDSPNLNVGLIRRRHSGPGLKTTHSTSTSLLFTDSVFVCRLNSSSLFIAGEIPLIVVLMAGLSLLLPFVGGACG